MSLCLILFISSCASFKTSNIEKQFENYISQGECDKAKDLIPELTKFNLVEKGLAVGSGSASYIATSASFVFDFLYYSTGGIMVPFAVCSPITLVEAFPVGITTGEKTQECWTFISNKMLLMNEDGLERKNLGEIVYDRTKPWRQLNTKK